MTGRTNVEQTLDAFLAPEADRLPDRVVDAALAEIARTPQRPAIRVPWRYSLMPSFSRASGVIGAAIVLVIVVIGAFALLGRPTPSVGAPTATPGVSSSPAISAPPLTQVPASELVPFTSAQYGYTVSIIKGWGAVVATRTLHGTEPLYGNDPQINTPAGDSIMGGFDAIQGGPTGRLLIAASPTPAGMNLATWTSQTAVAKCGAPTSQAATTVNGEAATLTTYFAGQACFGLSQQWVTVLHDGWAWNILWIDNSGSESADAFFFQQILGTFRFGTVPGASPVAS